MTKIRVFVDTNVIIEALRVHCWGALCKYYDVETVDKCIEEAMTGDYITITRNELVKDLKMQHKVIKKDIAELLLHYPCSQSIDDGEQQLFAFMYAQKVNPSNSILISTADKAAINVLNTLNWLDYTTSLEQLVQKCGITITQVLDLKKQYTVNWLQEIKTKLKLNSLP